MAKIRTAIKSEECIVPGYSLSPKDEGWFKATMPFDAIVIALNAQEKNCEGLIIKKFDLVKLLAALNKKELIEIET